MKYSNRAASVAAFLSTAFCGASFAQQQQNFDAVEIQALQVRDNVYMLVGAGGNITMQVGDDGILLVDTQFAPLSEKIVAAIRKISPKPIHYIVNTHHHGDHTGGNANLRAAGTTVSGGNMAGRHPRLRRRRRDRRARERVDAVELGDRRAGHAVGRLADQHVLRQQEGAVLQR